MFNLAKTVTVPLILGSAFLLAGCEFGLKDSEQTGYRGTAMAQINDADNAVDPGAVPAPPYELPPPSGELAKDVYENVQVLGNVDRNEFDYTMAAITQWIAPEQGCNYCHNPENLADDSLYTKVVARKMIQMTQNINQNWTDHVKQTGVTCYTCHRGNAIPAYYWTDAAQPATNRLMGNKRGQNTPDPSTAYASLPLNTFSMYMGLNAKAARIQSETMRPTPANTTGTRQAEDNYAIMMHLSQALGVNCTFCHNSRAFAAWDESTPKRALAWYGLQMVKNVNQEYIHPLTGVFPANRLGPMGDPFKANCTTCHQKQRKPLGGAPMSQDYPALRMLNYTPAPVEPAAEPIAEGAAAPAAAAAATGN